MNERQEHILRTIIEEYIRTAEPVGSKTLSERLVLNVSPATIRMEMGVLEAEGHIRQPHTSAGRVPTEQGYAYYIARFVKPRTQKATRQTFRKVLSRAHSQEQIMHALAKALVQLSGEMAVASFGGDRAYYTGFSQLVHKPDFQRLDVIQSLTSLLDRFDEVSAEVMLGIADSPQVIVGEHNPFGRETAAVLVRCRLPNGRMALLGLVGPMRMDYQKNLGLMEQVVEALRTTHYD